MWIFWYPLSCWYQVWRKMYVGGIKTIIVVALVSPLEILFLYNKHSIFATLPYNTTTKKSKSKHIFKVYTFTAIWLCSDVINQVCEIRNYRKGTQKRKLWFQVLSVTARNIWIINLFVWNGEQYFQAYRLLVSYWQLLDINFFFFFQIKPIYNILYKKENMVPKYYSVACQWPHLFFFFLFFSLFF